MKKKLPLTFTYDEVAKIFGVKLRTIYNMVSNVVSEDKPLQKVGAKSGFRATITSSSVVQLFIKKYEVSEGKAVEAIADKLYPEQSPGKAKTESSKSKLKEKEKDDLCEQKLSHGSVATKDCSNDTSETDESEESPTCNDAPVDDAINSNSIINDEKKAESNVHKCSIKESKNDKNGHFVWMYTFPFFDSNSEFDVQPAELKKMGTPEDYKQRLNFLADSFMLVCNQDGEILVDSVIVSFCSASPEGSNQYYHFHAIVMYKYQVHMSTAKNKFGESAHLEPVKRKQLKPGGKAVLHRDPIQGCIEYITGTGRFEGRKTEKCIAYETRGEGLFKAAAAEKAVTEQRLPKSAQITTAAKSGKTRGDILAAHPSFINPTGIEMIRFSQQRESWIAMGSPKTRPVRVMLVLGDIRSGKTKTILETMSSTKLDIATFSETTGLEVYEAQAALQIDHPNARWCPADLLEKLLSENIINLPVRKEGSVMTLWKWVFIEAKSIRDLEASYGKLGVRDLLKYVDKIRYCFLVETRKLAPTLFHDGYMSEAKQGANTRLDYYDIPVTRGAFRTRFGDEAINDELVHELTQVYFDITKLQGESSPELVDHPVGGLEKEDDINLTDYTLEILNEEYGDYERENIMSAYLTACDKTAQHLKAGSDNDDGPDL